MNDLQVERDDLQEELEDLAEHADRAEHTVRKLDTELKDVRAAMDASRDKYDSRVSDLNGEINRGSSKYYKGLTCVTNKLNAHRNYVINLQKELEEPKKELETLQGETADIAEMVKAQWRRIWWQCVPTLPLR